MSSSSTVPLVATVLSGLALVPMILGGLYVYNDIATFYQKSTADLELFQVRIGVFWLKGPDWQ